MISTTSFDTSGLATSQSPLWWSFVIRSSQTRRQFSLRSINVISLVSGMTLERCRPVPTAISQCLRETLARYNDVTSSGVIRHRKGELNPHTNASSGEREHRGDILIWCIRIDHFSWAAQDDDDCSYFTI